MKSIDTNDMIQAGAMEHLEEGQIFINGIFKVQKVDGVFRLFMRVDDAYMYLYYSSEIKNILDYQLGVITGIWLCDSGHYHYRKN